MPTEPPEMAPPTLDIATYKLVAVSALAIASSFVIGVALHQALLHPKRRFGLVMFDSWEPSRARVTLANLHQLAEEGFPRWHQEHPRDTCPRTIEELASYTNADIHSPYTADATYTFTCDPKLMPPGVHAIWLRDVGEDGIANTADDYTSDMTEDHLE